MTYEELREEIKEANLVLVGLGEDLCSASEAFYQELARLLFHKDYFIVSLSAGREELETAGLLPEQITVPLAGEDEEKSWERYLHWLSFTLNQRLCILEMGAGFGHPELIRFPFEKTCYFNQKARLIRINARFPQLPAEHAGRGISIQEDPAAYLTTGAGREAFK